MTEFKAFTLEEVDGLSYTHRFNAEHNRIIALLRKLAEARPALLYCADELAEQISITEKYLNAYGGGLDATEVVQYVIAIRELAGEVTK